MTTSTTSPTPSTTNSSTPTTPYPTNGAKVLMEEEVFATWFATSLVIAVMGVQFSTRIGAKMKTTVRVSIDLITMSLSFIVLAWAALSHFNVIPHDYRPGMLAVLIIFILVFYLYIAVLVGMQQI